MGSKGWDSGWDSFRAEDAEASRHGRRGATAQDFAEPGTGGPDAGGRGLRWLVPLRAVVVILAMAAAALGVLWVESAGVQGASQQLGSARAVAVPPLASGTAGNGSLGEATSGATATDSGSAVPTAGSGGILVVHVAGAVAAPGVFLLPAGSRVFEAVEKAGGALPTAELAALNLAAELGDGTQIFIPTVEQAAAGGTGPGSGQPPAGAPAAPGAGTKGAPGSGAAPPLNLNTATAAALEELPGLGPVLAQRIVQWRTDNGPFTAVDGLQAVPGIGTKLLAGLRELVAVP